MTCDFCRKINSVIVAQRDVISSYNALNKVTIPTIKKWDKLQNDERLRRIYKIQKLQKKVLDDIDILEDILSKE